MSDYNDYDDIDEMEEDDLAFKEMLSHFSGISEEALKQLAMKSVEELARIQRNEIVNVLKTMLAGTMKAEVKRLSDEFIQKIFSEVVVSKILPKENNWTNARTDITSFVKESFDSAVMKLNSSSNQTNFVRSAIDSFMKDEMTNMAKAAIAEFRTEVFAEMKKEGLKSLTRAIAVGLANEPKLLEMIKLETR